MCAIFANKNKLAAFILPENDYHEMTLKGTKVYGSVLQKCPKCHEGDLFTTNNPYDFSKLFDMPEKCPECGQKFLLEPGFYYGSMYVSYGLSIAYLVSVFVAMSVLYPDFNVTEYLVIGVGSLFVLTPYFFKLSRSIWINMFVGYDKAAIEKHNAKTSGVEQPDSH